MSMFAKLGAETRLATFDRRPAGSTPSRSPGRAARDEHGLAVIARIGQ